MNHQITLNLLKELRDEYSRLPSTFASHAIRRLDDKIKNEGRVLRPLRDLSDLPIHGEVMGREVAYG